MSPSKSEFPADKTERQRRKNLSGRDIKDLELAGGVEGGMQAGSAGGPGEHDSAKRPAARPNKR
jgi:hypothetical protein